MGMLWSASFRHLLRHPLQLLLALVGLALGVATIVAVDVATGSAARAFELSVAAVQGPATHELDGGPAGLEEAFYVHLARTLHHVRVNPVIDGYVTVADQSLQLLGVDPLAVAGFDGGESGAAALDSPAALTRWFTAAGTVMLAADTATRLQLRPGSAFSIDVGGHALPGRLLGVLAAGSALQSVMLTDIATAQEWLAVPGRLTRIDLRVPAGPAAAEEFAQLSQHLPAGVTLAAAAQRAR